MNANVCGACGGDGIAGGFVDDLGGEGEDRACEVCGGRGVVGPAFYSVAIYLVDRAYGGPEEGDWYYDCGVIVTEVLDGIPVPEMVRLFAADQLDAAHVWSGVLQAKLDTTVNVGRPSIGSVLSQGRYKAKVEDGLPRHHWPEVQPHYE
jgi:hypothetical protein